MPRRDTRPCVDCGEPAERVVRADRPWVCLECGIRRIELNARQQQAKRGPAYERWKRSMVLTAHLITRGIDP